jgi:PPOX class probable F420-dependent enzyme
VTFTGRHRREQVRASHPATDNCLFLEAEVAARNLVTMTETEVAAFLSEARTLNVATIGPDGGIHLVAMWFVMHGTSPVFWTYAKSQKVRNLSRDPRLSGLAENGESYQTLRGVELIGTAEVVSDPAEVLRVGQELSAKYAGLSPAGDLSRQAAKRVGVLLRPARTISWDHRKLATSG